MKIYQNLPKFGNLGKIGNLNFPAAYHVTTYGRVQERKENYKWGGEMPHSILNTVYIFVILSLFFAWIWPEWLTHVFI